MDPITIWTAIGASAAVLTICGAIYSAFRKSDMAKTDQKINSVDERVTAIGAQMTEKAHKEDVARIEARFERDISDLRTDQKSGFAEIRADIKDMRTDLMAAIRDAVK